MPSIWSTLGSSQASRATDPLVAELDARELAYDGPGRPPARLPLPEIDWGRTLQPQELSTGWPWPPYQLQESRDRLELYHELRRGDIRRLIDTRVLDNTFVAPVNIFRRFAKFIADIAIRSHPTAGQDDGPAADRMLCRVGHQLVSDMVAFGAGFVVRIGTGDDMILRAVDPRWVYPLRDGGWLLAEPKVSAQQALRSAGETVPDRVQLITFTPDGEVYAAVRDTYPLYGNWTQVAGPILDGGGLGEGALEACYSMPMLGGGTQGVWGTSWYDDLITLVVQMTRRMAANHRALDVGVIPTKFFTSDLPGLATDPSAPASAAVGSPGGASDSETLAGRLSRRSAFMVGDTTSELEYKHVDLGMEGAMAMVEELNKQISLVSGVPVVMSSSDKIQSGVSLRRMFWQFDASINPLFMEAKGALQGALMGAGLELEWESAMEEEVGGGMMNEAEDVEDEASAERQPRGSEAELEGRRGAEE